MTVVSFSCFGYRPIFIVVPSYQQHKTLSKLKINDNQLYVCTVLLIYFGFMVQIDLQSSKLKQEADLPQLFMLCSKLI